MLLRHHSQAGGRTGRDRPGEKSTTGRGCKVRGNVGPGASPGSRRGGGSAAGTLSSSSGRERTVHANTTFTDGAIVTTGWVLNDNICGGLDLTVLGTPTAPKHLILGPPGGATYAHANNSITGNSHNAFLGLS